MCAFGTGIPASHVALARARVHLAGNDPRAALDAVLPSLLARDAIRFTLPDAVRRSRWAAAVADAFDLAHRSAAACGDTLVLAELLEVARNNAVPLPRPAGSIDDLAASLGSLLAEPDGAGDARGALAGAAALAGGENFTELGLPARLRTPWHTIALADALERARHYHDPVRADAVVDWTVAVRS